MVSYTFFYDSSFVYFELHTFNSKFKPIPLLPDLELLECADLLLDLLFYLCDALNDFGSVR